MIKEYINIFANGSPLHASVINSALKSVEGRKIIINFRGMKTAFVEADELFTCEGEEFLNGLGGVHEIVKRIYKTHGFSKSYKLHISHSEYLLARYHIAVGGEVVYIDDGNGTYAAILDRLDGSRLFAETVLQDKLFKTPWLDKNLQHAITASFISQIFTYGSRVSNIFSPYFALVILAISRRLIRTYFEIDEKKKFNFLLLIDAFPDVPYCKSIDIIGRLQKNRISSKILIMLPPIKITGEELFKRFCESIIICPEFTVSEKIDIKCHPADDVKCVFKKFCEFTNLEACVVDNTTKLETAYWALEEGYKRVFCFNTSSTIYGASVFGEGASGKWIDMYKLVTGNDSLSDKVLSKIILPNKK